MVLAGVVIDKRDEKKLKVIGVKDSKKLSPKRREVLALEIEKIAKNIIILRVPACKIDSYREQKINLDMIEAMKMAEIIDMSDADRVFVDSLEYDSNKYKQKILKHLNNKKIKMVVENYSDETYPVVSAASIIAKVSRDEAVNEIKKQVNFDFGVGYSHDKRTIEFVKKLVNEMKELPTFVRRTWSTVQEMKKQSLQQKIKDFIFKKKEKCKEGEREK